MFSDWKLIFSFSSSDRNEIWICESCKNGSLSLNNNTVKIATSGFYYIHAQATFTAGRPTLQEQTKKPKVTLIRNKGPATQVRILSEVTCSGPGTLTMIRLFQLTEGESISLNIEPESLLLSIEAHHTYWEILLINKL